MALKIGLILLALTVLVSLTFWLRSRSRTSDHVEPEQERKVQLTEAEIRNLLRTVPGVHWGGAQEIEARLDGQDRAVCRRVALELFAENESPTIDDYWTLRSLAEIAGHPIPDKAAQAIIRHFNRMQKDREMLGPTLVLIGTEPAAKALTEAEEANEGRYFSRISYTLDDAVEHDRLDAGFRDVFSKHLAARAERNPKIFAKKRLGDLWMLVDPKSAVERLTRDPFWTPDFDGYWEVLQALVQRAARVPEERLWTLDELIKQRAAVNDKTRYPNPDLVWLLARVHSDRVAPHIEKLKQQPDLADRVLAAEAALKGIIQPRRVVHRHLESPGYFNSPAPVRHLWALELLGMELINGGMHQYFFNSAGDLWPDALGGLEQAGYARSALAFRKAIGVFGKEKPSTDRSVRFKQLDRLSKSKEVELNRFGDEVYEGMAETNTWQYIIRNADIFRTEPPQ